MERRSLEKDQGFNGMITLHFVMVLLRLLGCFWLGSLFLFWLLGLDKLAGLVRLPSSVGVRVVGLAGLGRFG